MSPPPYFAQWESPELVRAILRGQILAREDPAWASSGAESPDEYEWWGRRVCGMACLRSIVAAHGRTVPPTITLAKEVLAAGGYRRRDDGGLDGLIYAPFVGYLADRWSIVAQVAAPLDLEDLVAHVDGGAVVIASVSRHIRDPATTPRHRGGHLVLVFDHTGGDLIFHNPSGDTPQTQAGARLNTAAFARYFAGRGVIVGP
jgi:hypothetical protein